MHGTKGRVSQKKIGLRRHLVALLPRISEFCPLLQVKTKEKKKVFTAIWMYFSPEFSSQIQVKTKKKTSSPHIGTDFGRNFGSPSFCELIFSNLNFASDRKHVYSLCFINTYAVRGRTEVLRGGSRLSARAA